MAKRLFRIERDIERLKEKISEYQQQLKELEAAKTEQENLQIIQLVRSMNMTPDEFAAFLRSGALNATPTVTPYHIAEPLCICVLSFVVLIAVSVRVLRSEQCTPDPVPDF